MWLMQYHAHASTNVLNRFKKEDIWSIFYEAWISSKNKCINIQEAIFSKRNTNQPLTNCSIEAGIIQATTYEYNNNEDSMKSY